MARGRVRQFLLGRDDDETISLTAAVCFYLAALDVAFAVPMFFKSLGAGIAMSVIATLVATMGILKRKRILH
jgi:hypothetical protein